MQNCVTTEWFGKAKSSWLFTIRLKAGDRVRTGCWQGGYCLVTDCKGFWFAGDWPVTRLCLDVDLLVTGCRLNDYDADEWATQWRRRLTVKAAMTTRSLHTDKKWYISKQAVFVNEFFYFFKSCNWNSSLKICKWNKLAFL